MALPSPPPAPQRGDRATFSQRVDAFLLWLVAVIPMLNTFLSSITALAAGGANSFVYAFDPSLADSDPGASKVRFNSATQNSASMMRLDNIAGNGGDMLAFMEALRAGTSNVKASVRLQKVGDVGSYLLFDITNIVTASGYFNLSVVPRASSSSTPFAANDSLALFFDPKGDKGDGGNTPTQAEMLAAIGTLQIPNGGTGAVSASGARTNLGLGSVTNTSDADKPVSTAQQAALDGKLSRSGGLMTGNQDFINQAGIFMRTTDGNSHQLVNIGGDNNVNFTVAGGVRINYYNQSGDTIVASLTNTGAFTANVITQTSDERKKTNWRALTDAQLDALADLEKVGLFDWADGSGTSIGGGAQSIQAIVPWAVHRDEHGVLSVNYAGLAFAMAHGALRRASVK